MGGNTVANVDESGRTPAKVARPPYHIYEDECLRCAAMPAVHHAMQASWPLTACERLPNHHTGVSHHGAAVAGDVGGCGVFDHLGGGGSQKASGS